MSGPQTTPANSGRPSQIQSDANEQTSPLRAAAFFDVDHTLINCATEMHLALAVFKQTSIPKLNAAFRLVKVVIAIALYKMNISTDLINLKRKTYRAILKGCTEKELRESFDKVFKERLVKQLFPGSLEILRKHQADKHKVVLVSGSMQIVIDIIGNYLNVDKSYGTRLEIIDGICTGEIEGITVMSKNKSLLVEEYAKEHSLDLSTCFAYGDHWDDRFMLELTGNPTPVNPDKRLAQYARSKGWSVMKFAIN